MPAPDPEYRAHQEWLGYVQPVGLVVSIPALVAAQAFVNRNIAPDQQRMLDLLPRDKAGDLTHVIRDFPAFVQQVFGWQPDDLLRLPEDKLPERFAALEVVLPEYHETLRPTHVVPEPRPKEGRSPWILLVHELSHGQPLDENHAQHDRGWQATPQAKFERLLRETNVPAGLLCNGTHLRLVYAPRGESSGHITFPVADMVQVAGRPIFAGLHALLCAERLFTLPDPQRLPAILLESRKYQNTVSTQLAEQVLAAMFELLRGFQSAHDQSHAQLLREVLDRDPNHVYAGLLTTLLRLVFLLYAEDRGLISSDPVYANFYSVTGLFNRLREEAGRYPDTMDQRYGAWAQLLTLFRLIYSGGRHGGLSIPPRRGYLFDPERYPFLEGAGDRNQKSGIGGQESEVGGQESEVRGQRSEVKRSDNSNPKSKIQNPKFGRPKSKIQNSDVPRVPDGVVFRVLNNLLILDGERLSYRQLDVEQIGSVYEAIMGFHLEVAQGRSIAVRPAKPHGAPATINLDALLSVNGKDRGKWLKEQTDQTLTGTAAEELKMAETLEALVSALDRKLAKAVTPNLVPAGAMVLQPSDERRRSGSHYTPRSLTGPIVTTTLKPVLERLSQAIPTPEQLLDLKVCDPAMGSGAFLVETCRQLGDALVKSWHAHGCLPADIPADEDEILHARRLVAQRCLYGVDRNPLAVDLAKLSLWLATLAKDHPFTFLDHALREGDSLVGLTREQIARFDWQAADGDQATGTKKKNKAAPAARPLFADPIAQKMQAVSRFRQEILASRDRLPYHELRQRLDYAEEQLSLARMTGDLVVAAFFSADKDRGRENRLHELSSKLVNYIGPPMRIEDHASLAAVQSDLHAGKVSNLPSARVHPICPFHWEIEFPEVFDRHNPGFDAIVGNPPFLGGPNIGKHLGIAYHECIVAAYERATGLADLVAFFLRRVFDLVREKGAFGVIAKNTILQGDTRICGLETIMTSGGQILEAHRRTPWPGEAAVNVCVVCIARTLENVQQPVLDGDSVTRISAFLLKGNVDTMPCALTANKRLCFQGTKIWGSGFVFEQSPSGGSSSLEDMHRIIAIDPSSKDVILSYIGGDEFNTDPRLEASRYVIDFGARSQSEARRWPHLFALVEERVRPVRVSNKQRNYRENWWLHTNRVEEAGPYAQKYGRLLALSSASKHLALGFVSAGTIAANTLVVFLIYRESGFAVLQSRTHETWVRFVGSSLEDRLRYTTQCFETYPVPENWEASTRLDVTGRTYYVFRADLMVRNNEGFTKTYNRFHDPDERSLDILKLRELHAAMDRAVLEAYGWPDLAASATCEFLLDYEDDEDDELDPPTAGRRQKRKPWRYRWPDEFRDEVLARLLALNAQRAEEERLAGQQAESKAASAGKKHPAKGRTKKPRVESDALFERDRERFYILMLLRAWNRPLTRHALDAGLVLMLNDEIRTGLLRVPGKRRRRKPTQLVAGLDHVLQELELLGHVEIDNTGVQQVLRIGRQAPSTDAAPHEDLVRVDQVRQVFDLERTRGKVTVTQERIDASPDLIPV